MGSGTAEMRCSAPLAAGSGAEDDETGEQTEQAEDRYPAPVRAPGHATRGVAPLRRLSRTFDA